jgi:hypothetical protein
VCNQVVDRLNEDANIRVTEMPRRLKDEYKIIVPYRRVYRGKYLAMDQIYGPWENALTTCIGLSPSRKKLVLEYFFH